MLIFLVIIGLYFMSGAFFATLALLFFTGEWDNMIFYAWPLFVIGILIGAITIK